MPVKQAEGKTIPDDFGFQKHPELRDWTEKEFPRVDPEKTMTQFIEWADDIGRMASKWTACYKRVVRIGVEKGYSGIVVYKNGKYDDPKWKAVLAEAHEIGFREPSPLEPTVGTYRVALETWKSQQKRSDPAPHARFGEHLKLIAK